MTLSEQHIGIFTIDTDLIVRSWDHWLAQVTQIPAATAHHRPLAELVPNLESRGLLARFRRVLSEGNVEVLAPAFHRHLIACPPRQPSKYFTTMQQWVTIAPLRENNRIAGAIVTIEDVTARLERERDLAEQLASPDEATRLQAAQAIEAEKVAAHILVGALDDQSWRVRRTAVSGLARYGGAESVAALLKALREEHQNPSVLNSALQVLALTDIDVIPALVECVRSPDTDLRIYATLSLGERPDPRAIPALLGALDDPDTNVRYHAIEALGKLRVHEATEALLAITESRDFFLAFPAIDALTRIGAPHAAARLAPLLDDEMLRAPAAEALGRLGDESAIAPLVALLNAPDAPALAIVQALAALHDHYQQTYGEGRYIADLVRQAIEPTGAHNLLAALEQAQAEELRSLALILGWLEGPAVQRTLARLLGQPAVRKAVLEALVRHGAGVTELLIEQLTAEDIETRRAAIIALGRIGDARAVPALMHSLNEDPELATAAAAALGAIGDRRAFEALLGLVGHPSAPVRQAAVGALNSLGHPELAAHTLELLGDPDPRVRESAVKIAGYFGYPNCADALLERCDDVDERVRRAAVEHLPYLDDERVPGTLAQALGSPVPGVRAAAARALAQVDGTSAQPYLLAALDDPDAWVRYFAARSIGQQRYEEALDVIARLAQTDPASQVRIAAMETLGRLGGARVIALLAPFVTAADSDIARAALGALAAIDHPDVLAPLGHALRATDPARRIDGLRALARRGAADTLPLLQQTLGDSDSQVAQAAIDTLAGVGSEPVVAILLGLLAEPARREAGIAALAQLGDGMIDRIAGGLAHPDPTVRGAVVEALSRMKRPRASERISEALEDPDASVRLAAADALGQLGNRQAERQLAQLARFDPDLTVRRAAHAALQR